MGAPQCYLFPCSHGNISFLQNRKEAEKMKVVYIMGGSHTCAFSWGLGTPTDAPPTRECTRMGISPTTLSLSLSLSLFKRNFIFEQNEFPVFVCFGFKIYKWVDILFSLRNSRNFGKSFSLRGIFHNLEHKKNGSLIWITKVQLETNPRLYIDD
jgi:hypothetical protein